jgi:transposase
VSCKHNAKSGKAVSETDEPNIRERLESFRADGFIGFYSTVPSSGLNNRLAALRNEQKIRDYRVFDSREIENYLVRVGYSKLMMRYLPDSYKRTKPLHILGATYLPLECRTCGKDLLEELHQKEYRAIIVTDSTFDEAGIETIHDFCWLCKGACDRENKEIIRSQPKHIDRWQDISDLDIPLKFLSWLFAILNNIRCGKVVFTDDGFEQMKAFIEAMSQRVFREMTEAERARVSKLMSYGI